MTFCMVFCSIYISHHKSPQIDCRIAFLQLLFPGDTWNLFAFLRSQEPRWIVFVISEPKSRRGKTWAKNEVCYAVFIANMSAAYGPPATRPQYQTKVVAVEKTTWKHLWHMICALKNHWVQYIEWLLAIDLTIQFGTQRSGEEDPIWFFSGRTPIRRGSNDHWAAALWLHWRNSRQCRNITPRLLCPKVNMWQIENAFGVGTMILRII